jgi:hypothetical protein
MVPVGGIALGALGVGAMLRRWRRSDRSKKAPVGEGGAAKDAYDSRLDDELKDLDG